MKELIVILTAASPFFELRGAIPLSLMVFHFSVIKTIILSLLGNILIIPLILIFLEKVSNYLSKKFLVFKQFFNWLFEKTKKKFLKNYLKWGKVALVIFVAIPLPFTGAWTGSVAAFLFGFDKKEAFFLISLGVIIALIIVTFFTLLGIKIF